MASIHEFPGSPFRRALAAGVQANVPTGVIGEPGQGKTATMESSTSGWGRHCETVIGSNREATDFPGSGRKMTSPSSFSSHSGLTILSATP